MTQVIKAFWPSMQIYDQIENAIRTYSDTRSLKLITNEVPTDFDMFSTVGALSLWVRFMKIDRLLMVFAFEFPMLPLFLEKLPSMLFRLLPVPEEEARGRDPASIFADDG